MRHAAANHRDREGARPVPAVSPPAVEAEPAPRPVPVPGLAIRRMTVGGAAKASSVSGTTMAKHVMAEAGQAAAAQAGYGSRTFVTDAALLTAAVDADPHDFAAGPARSARHDINAMVTVHQYSKTEAPPAGFAEGRPVAKTIDGVSTNCEIGAVKTGAGDVSITHFKKV